MIARTVAAMLVAASPLFAQVAGRGSLVVTVTTQNGSIRLPGASVTVTSLDGHTLASDVSDGEGRLTLSDVPPGVYEVRVSLMGFDDVRATVRVEGDRPAAVTIDLPLSGVSERVDVIGNAETAPPTIGETLSTKGVLESRVIEQLPIRDHSVLSALKLLAGIVDGPGGVSIKGGRSNQSGLQIGMAALTDSTTGAPLFRLPPDAIDSVEVLPNPYAVEFGRFSSGHDRRQHQARGRFLARRLERPRPELPQRARQALGVHRHRVVRTAHRIRRSARQGPAVSRAERAGALRSGRGVEPSAGRDAAEPVVQHVHAPRREPVAAQLADRQLQLLSQPRRPTSR